MIYYLENAFRAVEHRIHAIGPVNCDTYCEAGEKIELAEREMAGLMERMGMTGADAADYVSYYFLPVKNYFRLLDARREYDLCAAEAEDGVAAILTLSEDTVAAGEKVSVQYRVRNLSDIDKVYSYIITYPLLHAEVDEGSAPLCGNLTVAAGEEGVVALEFTAREGGVLRIGAKLFSAEDRLLSDRVTDVQITGAGCYFGVTHSHSTESDGKGTLAQNFRRMMQGKMSLTYTADHNARVSDKDNFNRALEAMEACGYRFIALKGTEITVYGNNGHMLSYGNNIDFTEPPRVRTQETIDNWNHIIDQINQAGGYAYLAHPLHCWFNFPGFAPDCDEVTPDVEIYQDILDLYTEMNGMEIINYSYHSGHGNNIKAIAYWDRMNCKGYKKYFATGGSDGHTLDELCLVYNGFLLDDLTTESLLDAHRNGKLFVTTGPELRFTLGDKTFGQTLFTKESTAKLSVKAHTPSGHLDRVVLYDYAMDAADPEGAYARGVQTTLYQHEDGDESNYLLCEQEIEVHTGHFYRVAVFTDDKDKVAFSNPIWVE